MNNEEIDNLLTRLSNWLHKGTSLAKNWYSTRMLVGIICL